jgi:ketosteroid isomerase-like protein
MHRTLIALVLSLSAWTPGEAAACRSDGPDVQAIKAAIDRYVAAVDREDVDTLINTYSKDIQFMVEGGPTTAGVEHARKNFQSMFARTRTHYVVHEDEVTVCGPIAYDTGTVVFQMTPKSGGAMREAKARFLEIWRKGPTGWQISRLMNNREG